MEYDELISKILEDFLNNPNFKIEFYIKKFPEHKDSIIAKIGSAERVKKNLSKRDLSGKIIKVLPESFTRNTGALRDFQIELNAIMRFNHPNIARVYSLNNESGIVFIIMEYVEGLSLKEIIRILKNNPSPGNIKAESVRQILRANGFKSSKQAPEFWDRSYSQFVTSIGSEIADAVCYAHRNNIVHGILQPKNILLTADCIPKIVDFGLSLSIKKIESAIAAMSAEHFIYTAPEYIRENIGDEKTDIWSLGCILHEMLTFKNPFLADSAEQSLKNILNCRVSSLRALNKNIPVDLEIIVLKCLECDPEHRYKAMEDVLKDLNNYLSSRRVVAKIAGASKKFIRSFYRKPLNFLFAFCLLWAAFISVLLFLKAKTNDIVNTGANYYNENNDDQALDSYYKALRFIRFNPFLRYRLKEIYSSIGEILADKGNCQAAIGYYEKAAKLDPYYIRAISGAAQTYYKCGSFDKAIKYAYFGIGLSPGERDCYYWLGKSLAAQGLFDDSIKNLCKAAGISPGDSQVLNEIISIIGKKGLQKESEITQYLQRSGADDGLIKSVLSYRTQSR